MLQFDEICDYATQNQVRDMLQEYMRRLIVEQPKEPLKFLIKEITENPFVITPKDGADAEEKQAAQVCIVFSLPSLYY